MKKCKILYFTRNQSHATAFEERMRSMLSGLQKDYLERTYNEDEEFLAEQAKSSMFYEVVILDSLVISSNTEGNESSQENDLGGYLASYDGRLSELYIIIDYVSFCKGENKGKNYSLASSFKIRELILKYPEVNFSFDEHLTHKYHINASFVDFLITTNNLKYTDFVEAVYTKEAFENFTKNNNLSVKELINIDLHSFDIDDKDSILKLCYYNDNLFDASNLRFALKAQKYHNLVVAKPNFARVQLSRASHLALVVEEERSQNLFNCYSAYASGYRCLPVTTASGLIWSNNGFSPQIVLRDYDLQFPDESGNEEIHQVRGWRCTRKSERIPWECTLDNNNKYWKNLIHYEQIGSEMQIVSPATPVLKSGLEGVYYISKGVLGLEINMTGPFGRQKNNKYRLRIPGTEKPISGIYASLVPMFKDVYLDATYRKSNSHKDYINTTRKKGNHGVPLDIYYMVKSMVDRAWKYYNEEHRYIHAAILAQEIIEVLNGFHESLLLQAYHILAISENAIAMNAIGGDEEALKKDALFRIKKIDYEIDRILRRPKGKRNGKETGSSNEDRREFKYNILNQIFSDCRKFCQEKEHFSAEDCFISAMAHVNEGFTPCDIWHEFRQIIKEMWKNWEAKRNGLNIDDCYD